MMKVLEQTLKRRNIIRQEAVRISRENRGENPQRPRATSPRYLKAKCKLHRLPMLPPTAHAHRQHSPRWLQMAAAAVTANYFPLRHNFPETPKKNDFKQFGRKTKLMSET